MDLVISPLGEVHDRKSFNCGEQSLNQYLHQHANQVIKRRINKVFVASRPETPQQVVGYYSLSAFSLDVNDLPENRVRGYPGIRFPLFVLLGRFAVAEFHQGKGFGSLSVHRCPETYLPSQPGYGRLCRSRRCAK